MGSIQKLSSFHIRYELEKICEELKEFEGAKHKVKELYGYLSPLVYWRDMKIIDINETHVEVEIGKESSFTIESAYVAKGLQNCHRVTLLAATIGKELIYYSKRKYEEGKLWESTIADGLGSHAVEILVEKFHKYLSQYHRTMGLYPSLRFSPGYGDWSLDDQRKILNILDSKPEITVHLSGMLEPVKSITAVIGWSTTPLDMEYPVGKKNHGLCEGIQSCKYCRTWACRK